MVFCTGDRVEQFAGASSSFFNNLKLAHYYAGCINEPAVVFDDIIRHQITLMSDIQFVENMFAAEVVWDLKNSVRLKADFHIVGISHLDDLEIDESKVPHTCMPECRYLPYDLVLINYTKEEFNIPRFGNMQIQIGSNPDGNIYLPIKNLNDTFYQNLPRAQFLGLLKNCEHFITNSSCAYYEAPYFLKPEQIIMIGSRNRKRHAVTMNQGASDKIVKILEEYLR